MAKNVRHDIKTNLFYLLGGETTSDFTEPAFPYLQWHGDTWRKKIFYNEFMFYWKSENKTEAMEVLKKAWCEHNTSCRKDRRMLNLEILLGKCTDHCLCCDEKLWYGRCYNSIEEVKSRDSKPSIDKLDPDGEYTDANTWVICTTCNTYKNNAKTPYRLEMIADAWKEQINK